MKLVGVGDYGVELVGGHALRLDGAEGWHVLLRLRPTARRRRRRSSMRLPKHFASFSIALLEREVETP